MLLIDITYDFEENHTKREYRIKIEPNNRLRENKPKIEVVHIKH